MFVQKQSCITSSGDLKQKTNERKTLIKKVLFIVYSIPKTLGVAIPMKATFFITYVMVDGWAGIAGEILRLKPLVMYHIKNTFLVKTEKDREQAMDPGSLEFGASEPRIQLYFLLGLVYSVVTPILLPFITIFFAFAYVVFRHQVCYSFYVIENFQINTAFLFHSFLRRSTKHSN